MKKENIYICKATSSDVDSLIRLLEDLFSIEEDFCFNEQKQRQGIWMLLNDSRSYIIVAKFNGNIVGMCTIQRIISTAEGGEVGIVEDVIIDKKYRNKQIGTILLQAIEKYSKENELSRLQLLVDKKNTPALNFYQKINWNTTNLICLRKLFYINGER